MIVLRFSRVKVIMAIMLAPNEITRYDCDIRLLEYHRIRCRENLICL